MLLCHYQFAIVVQTKKQGRLYHFIGSKMPMIKDGGGTHFDPEAIQRSAATSVRMLMWLEVEVLTIQDDPISAKLISEVIDSIYEVSGIASVEE